MTEGLYAPTIRSEPNRKRSGLAAIVLTALFPSAGWEKKSEAAVVATNTRGETRRLFVASTDAEAVEKATRVSREWEQLGPVAWCERYGVPADWLRA